MKNIKTDQNKKKLFEFLDLNVLDKETPTFEELCQKYKNIPREQLLSQLELGREVESEHTSHENIADEIARDHLNEDPGYYSKLLKMEKK
jgi:hypothetical protein